MAAKTAAQNGGENGGENGGDDGGDGGGDSCICAPTIKRQAQAPASACARTTPESEHSSVIASAA
jgi:hypothetical protein